MGEITMKRAVFFLLFVGIASSITSLVFANATYTESHDVRRVRAHLSELDDQYTEIKSSYLRLALEELEPQARAQGFVALESPRYIRPQTAVGFAR
ncbi:MAG: hypothetical protein EXS68_00225 [Candidatus Ryanbacteria bacterium]|nr:hypothetical protein [Candidatus Ryanbacteria bacterium]